MKKGQQVYISGRLETDSWEDDTGNKKYKTRVVADGMTLLSSKTPQELPQSPTELHSGLNEVTIVGNITQDIELRSTPNGAKVTSFGVATNSRWKDKKTGEAKERTEFHNVVAWEALATGISEAVRK